MTKLQRQRISLAVGVVSLAVVTVSCSGIKQHMSKLLSDSIHRSTPAQIALAEHLKNRGSKLYSTFWCPYCKQQKELFGSAGQQIPVIECDPNGKNAQPKLCVEAKVSSFPTWEIDGRLYPGLRSLDELADLSQYQGSREFSR